MLKRVSLAFFTLAGVAAASTFGACSSSSGGGADAGMDSPGPSMDVVTVFETAPPPDTFVGTPDTTTPTPETSTPDVVTPIPESGADHVSPSDAKTEAGHVGDGGKEGGSHFDAGACTMVGLAGSSGGTTCPAPMAGTCSPSAVSTLPPVSAPSGAYQGLCTAAQITSVYNDCFNNDTCPEADTTNPAYDCYSCIITDQSSTKWGPLVQTVQNIVNINFGGCITLLEPCNKPCGDAVEEEFACTEAACGANCVNADNDAGTVTPLNDCSMTADGCDPDGCFAPYNEAYGTGGCLPQLTGASHPAAACFPATQTFQAAFEAVVPVFCGSPP